MTKDKDNTKDNIIKIKFPWQKEGESRNPVIELNLAEYPVAVPFSDSEGRKTEYTLKLEKTREFKITCGMGLPDPLDMAILVYLLSKAYYLGTDEVHFSLREVGQSIGNMRTQRVKEAIERWGNTVMNFVETFQTEEGKQTSITFESFLKRFEYWTPSKKVGRKRARDVTFVQFNPALTRNLREHKLYAEINWDFFTSIADKGIAARLYLYLMAKLRKKKTHRVTLSELIAVLPVSVGFQRKDKALRYIQRALDLIVQNGEIEYEYRKRWKTFVFRKVGGKKPLSSLIGPGLTRWLRADLEFLGLLDSAIQECLGDPERALKALVSVAVFEPKDERAFFMHLYKKQTFSTQKVLAEFKKTVNRRIHYCSVQLLKRHSDAKKDPDPAERILVNRRRFLSHEAFIQRLRDRDKDLKTILKDKPFTHYYLLMRIAEEMAGVKNRPIVMRVSSSSAELPPQK